MAERIGKEEFEEKVLKSNRTVLVDFYSDSCIACKKLVPVLNQVQEQLEGSFHFYKVNTNYEEKLTEKYDILSRPTLIIFKNGQEVDRKTGVWKPQELIDWLRSF